ncbi:dnaJ homolog subfamily C member 13-like [Tigriopus californicus]|uniref:dnaJ homolog subfamily C member 13-like n=1 Tax=Tigriopus californicus TaxID=6832 RepID=UPI0027DAAA54|nr:dnaJ homolog subfamily C member 13-like [Tigriopus californicus]
MRPTGDGSTPNSGGGSPTGGVAGGAGGAGLNRDQSGAFLSRAFWVTKHSWKGKYRRVFVVGPGGVSTLNPSSLEATNAWPWSDVVSLGVSPAANHAGEFHLVVRKGHKNSSKTDSMRFSSAEYKDHLLSEAWQHGEEFAEPSHPQCWFSYKYHWSEQRVSVLLQAAPHALQQRDPATKALLSSHFYRNIKHLYDVPDFPGGFVIQEHDFGRLHLFASEAKKEILAAMSDHAANAMGIHLAKVESMTFERFVERKFGQFSDDLHITSISEFLVYKHSARHPEGPVRRKFCVSETCLIERDPATYSIVSLRPLSSVAALIRHLDNTQLFSIQFNSGELRSYTSTERDSLLASFLDGVRGSGNRDVHVRMTPVELGKRFCPLECAAEEEVESMHLKLLASPPVGWKFADAISRFNANVSYSGLTHAVTQEHLFAENKEKLIQTALVSILNRDVSEVDKLPIEELEQQFHALRRLVASKAGFAGFTALPGFREKIGMKVARALKLGHDGISHAAIDMICALMEPMHDNYDLRQEQLNKSSLLSSDKFLDALLDMWTVHVVRGTGALIVSAMLDFLTFSLCAPYSETTDGKQFELLLEKVADRGRTLYRLFQQPSHSIVKGAGLLMKAIIEEGTEEIGHKMQLLALSEGALPIHLVSALFTKSEDNRLLTNCQLSRHLVGLWTTDNQNAIDLLDRVFPAGLLTYLTSNDQTPTKDVDRLHVRDNLKLAVTDAESGQGNAVLRVAGRGLKNAKTTAAKTAEVVSEKTIKYTEEAWKASEKYIDVAMEHWKTKMGKEFPVNLKKGETSLSSKFHKNQDRPIVLRKRRQRIKTKLNWSLFYYMFNQNHSKPDLIWNIKTRQELRESLESEIQSFVQDRELGGGSLISWNYAEFEVLYNSLSEEIKIGDYFLRLLLEEDQSEAGIESVIHKPSDFFNDLYHRFLLTPKTEMKCLCLQAMAIVYGRHFHDIGSFHDTKYIVAMLERTTDRMERDRLLLFLNKLVCHKDNAHAFTLANGVRIMVDLLPLAHLHTSRAVVNNNTTAIEVNPESQQECQEKEWYYGNADKERNGPLSFSELQKLFQEKSVHPKSKVWAQGLESWKLLQQVAQLKWNLIAKGQAVMNESEMASLILSILISVCRYYPSKDEDGAIIRPLPKVKQALSDSANLPHLVQLLLTFDPTLVEKTSILLHLVLEDNARLATLYLTGFFFFVLMYTGSNVLPIGRFLAMAHSKQAFRSEEKKKAIVGSQSILAQMLPDAMVAYLENHGPERFAEIFLGEFDTPEAIWNSEMRQFMIQKIAYHLADFTPRLKSNVRALYQYCPIPLVAYPALEFELFCDIYYLRNLCDEVKFPEWPIMSPLSLLKEVLAAWRLEVEKKPSSMTTRDALAVLGLQANIEPEEGKIRKAYFKMAQQYHPDKNPQGRTMFEKVNAAYEFLCSRSTRSNDHPSPENIVLILRAQSILFSRYSKELHPYKYAGYPMLIKTIQMETADEKLFSKSAPLLAAASECAYFTVKCSALNAEELRREDGLQVLYQAFERCVSVLGQDSKPTDVAVQVCIHVIRFFAVASEFPACCTKMVEMPDLVKNICRVFYYKQLTALCSVAAECVSAMAVDEILQMHFLQAGVLWHLLLFLFEYDYTLEESGVVANEATSQQAVANRLAKLAVVACARLAGLGHAPQEDPEVPQPPKNQVIEDSLRAMLTPYIVSKMALRETEEVLKLLNSNSETPYLVWDNGTRAELTDFLETESTSSVRTGTCDPTFGATFKFTAHEDELVVGDIFLRIYNQQPMFTLLEPKRFAVDLLEFLNGRAQYLYSLLSMTQGQIAATSENLKFSEMALESLANVIKHNRGVEIQCIGHFKLLFCLLRLESYPNVQEMTLRVLSNVTGSSECVDDISASRVLTYLIQVIYSLEAKQELSLTVFRSLMGDTRLVKECLTTGGVICLVKIFCCSNDQPTREIAAETLSTMSADKLMGPKVRIVLNKFIPEIFLDAIKKSPETGVQLLETNHENPELIWNEDTREKLLKHIHDLAMSHYNHIKSRPDIPWNPSEQELNINLECNELVISGIYIRLFNANPGWVLRKPREFLSDLLENVVQMISAKTVDQTRLESVSTALIKLLMSQPNLAEMIPGTGYISRLFSVMGQIDEKVVKAGIMVTNEIARSAVCVENMGTISCIPSLKRAMKLRQDLIPVSCEMFSRIFEKHHENLTKQSLDCGLIPDLLSLLDSPLTNQESRALIVKGLKSLQCSLQHGEQVSALLKASSVWKQFEQQKHDLFITSQNSGGYLTATPGVAGYLTSTAKPAPTMPPPMEDKNSSLSSSMQNPLL